MFSVDDIVWAKSSVAREIFWPARVIESDSDLEDIKYKKNKPTVACVTFLAEGTFEAIKNSSNVQRFNCDRKEVFLKKGRNLKKQGKRLQFESAVKEAERYVKLHGKRKRTPTKYFYCTPDTKKEASSPQTRRRVSVATTSIVNKTETKPSPQAKTKCSLPTILEESGEMLVSNVSTSTEQNKIDNCKEKIVTKRGRKRKNIELDCENKDNNMSLVSSRHRTRGRPRSNSLNEPSTSRTSHKIDPKLENGCNSSLQSNSVNKATITKATCENCLGIESTDNAACEKTNRKRFSFKSNIKECLRKKFKSSSKGKPESSTVCKTDSKIKQNDNLETISEECESKRDGMMLKWAGNENGNSETDGKDSTAFRKETKRPRIALCEDGRENEAPLPNNKSGLKKQNSSRQNTTMDGSESSFSKNNEIRKAADSSTKAKQSLDACLESLNAPSYRNANGLGHSELDGIQPRVSCDDSGLACDKTADMLRCNENENKFESFVEKGENADVKDKESDEEDNAKDDCSSDDESLPEAFSFSPGTKTNFRPGDVVWVKHQKDPFWPAQINREASSNKKTHVYVKFLPKSDRRGIKVPKKNVKLFTEDHETFLRYKNQEVDPSSLKEFNEAVEQGEKILVRRVFPDQVSDVSDDDGLPSPSNDKQDKPVVEADKPADEKPEDGESGFDSSETENLEVAGNGRTPRKRKQVTRYSNILKELHWCKQRLLDIYREKFASTRHKTFKYGTVTEKNSLKHRAGFGPIQDEETVSFLELIVLTT
ncbi:Hypothetical predicted protein [Paramuricea clavata]|uniref:Uncharacterized protein n=1 Tax=Paramuricea clavata TaxID=317549 RepID=A0A7D9E1U1_PARCT|nr:Hypothetical predicted protein [Paramuricea clavata]